METKESLIQPLLDSVEEYGKTSFELIRLKAVDKTANVASMLLSRLALLSALFLFIVTLNIAVALWLGDLMGKNYYGFLIVALFYGLVGTILFFLHPTIKTRINNSIIIKVFK